MGVIPHREAARTGAISNVGFVQIAAKPFCANTRSAGCQQQAKRKHKNMKTMKKKGFLSAGMAIAIAM